jgi:hypothetical protein
MGCREESPQRWHTDVLTEKQAAVACGSWTSIIDAACKQDEHVNGAYSTSTAVPYVTVLPTVQVWPHAQLVLSRSTAAAVSGVMSNWVEDIFTW